MKNSPRVRADMLLRVTDDHNKQVPVFATAYYEASDPYAVVFEFDVGYPEPIRWLFARELLFEGLSSVAGQGDVRIWPGGEPAGSVVAMLLSSPTGQALFEIPRPAVTEFLKASWSLVEPGEEENFINFDQELSDLLTRESWRGV